MSRTFKRACCSTWTATRLEDKLPGRQLVAFVYGPARIPPQEEMPPNVVLFADFHLAELEADRILAADPATGLRTGDGSLLEQMQ